MMCRQLARGGGRVRPLRRDGKLPRRAAGSRPRGPPDRGRAGRGRAGIARRSWAARRCDSSDVRLSLARRCRPRCSPRKRVRSRRRRGQCARGRHSSAPSRARQWSPPIWNVGSARMHSPAEPDPRRRAAPIPARHCSAGPRTPAAAASPAARSQARSRARPIGICSFLCLVLMGFAMDGKGFAYFGIPPLFIGEATTFRRMVRPAAHARLGEAVGIAADPGGVGVYPARHRTDDSLSRRLWNRCASRQLPLLLRRVRLHRRRPADRRADAARHAAPILSTVRQGIPGRHPHRLCVSITLPAAHCQRGPGARASA